VEIKRPGRGKGCRCGQWLDQQRLIRFKRCGDLNAVARAVLFKNNGISAKFGADLRHCLGYGRGLE
jgi:hypothetical protein